MLIKLIKIKLFCIDDFGIMINSKLEITHSLINFSNFLKSIFFLDKIELIIIQNKN